MNFDNEKLKEIYTISCILNRKYENPSEAIDILRQIMDDFDLSYKELAKILDFLFSYGSYQIDFEDFSVEEAGEELFYYSCIYANVYHCLDSLYDILPDGLIMDPYEEGKDLADYLDHESFEEFFSYFNNIAYSQHMWYCIERSYEMACSLNSVFAENVRDKYYSRQHYTYRIYDLEDISIKESLYILEKFKQEVIKVNKSLLNVDNAKKYMITFSSEDDYINDNYPSLDQLHEKINNILIGCPKVDKQSIIEDLKKKIFNDKKDDEKINELKSCPFCGSNDIEIVANEYNFEFEKCYEYHITCNDCKVSTDCSYDLKDIVGKWNRRAE